MNKTRGVPAFPFLQDPVSGEVKSDQSEVKEIVQNFLKDLFQGSFSPVVQRELTAEDLTEHEEEEQNKDPNGQEQRQEGNVEKELELDFTEREVGRMIAQLKNGKAVGCDKVPNEALKNSIPEFVTAVTKLFNNIKRVGQAPEAWKIGRMVLIHKKGSLTDMGNYRPLTVLAAMSGLFSRVLNERLTSVVERKNILGEVQQGFRKNRRGADNTCPEHDYHERNCNKEASTPGIPGH